MVAGELAFAVGHKGHLMWAHLAHKVHQVVKRITFDVELAIRPGLHHRNQLLHVLRANVAFVGSWMHGDALRPCL
jgi:hypothetical protein